MDGFLLWRVGDEGKGGRALEMRCNLIGSGGEKPSGDSFDKGSLGIFCEEV